jgi:hypothetical protein
MSEKQQETNGSALDQVKDVKNHLVTLEEDDEFEDFPVEGAYRGIACHH